jgi:hypothetical protein
VWRILQPCPSPPLQPTTNPRCRLSGPTRQHADRPASGRTPRQSDLECAQPCPTVPNRLAWVCDRSRAAPPAHGGTIITTTYKALSDFIRIEMTWFKKDVMVFWPSDFPFLPLPLPAGPFPPSPVSGVALPGYSPETTPCQWACAHALHRVVLAEGAMCYNGSFYALILQARPSFLPACLPAETNNGNSNGSF